MLCRWHRFVAKIPAQLIGDVESKSKRQLLIAPSSVTVKLLELSARRGFDEWGFCGSTGSIPEACVTF